MQKQDMSEMCEFKNVELYYKLQNGEITQEEYDNYWDNYCSKCEYMNEICMYGDGDELWD
jgi:hypothetical protein